MTFIPTAHAVTKQVVLQLQARLPLLSPGHSAFIIAGPCQKPLGGITGRQHGKHILLIFLARRCSGSSWPCMSSWAILNPTIPETTAACNLTTSAIPVRNSVQLPLLTVIAQVITALDNKRAHYQRSVLDQHIPFFRRVVDRQIYNLPYRSIVGNTLRFLMATLITLCNDSIAFVV